MNLKQLKSVSGQTRISDAWKPVKLTQKNIRDRFDYVIDAGTMTGYQSCRSYYTAGTYGWNADVFIVGGGINACVVAGNRAFGNIKAPRDLIKEYEDKAYEVNYNSKELDKLIDEFAYKVLAANGISDSRKIKDEERVDGIYESNRVKELKRAKSMAESLKYQLIDVFEPTLYDADMVVDDLMKDIFDEIDKQIKEQVEYEKTLDFRPE
jgi:hypothetical protein